MQEAYTWLAKNIESCNSTFHFEAVDVLISLFETMYKEEDKEEVLSRELRGMRARKWADTHTILF